MNKPLPPEITAALQGDPALKNYKVLSDGHPMSEAMSSILATAMLTCRMHGYSDRALIAETMFHGTLQMIASVKDPAEFEAAIKRYAATTEELARVYRQTHEVHGVFDAQQSSGHRPSRP